MFLFFGLDCNHSITFWSGLWSPLSLSDKGRLKIIARLLPPGLSIRPVITMVMAFIIVKAPNTVHSLAHSILSQIYAVPVPHTWLKAFMSFRSIVLLCNDPNKHKSARFPCSCHELNGIHKDSVKWPLRRKQMLFHNTHYANVLSINSRSITLPIFFLPFGC